ncbi:MAG TPA: family 20 glycosylhydrolase [bacterium]|nr:family 20 glycosylhydrolase [bacterium]
MRNNTVKLLSTLLTLMFVHLAAGQPPASQLNLMPVPEKVELLAGKYRLDAGFTVRIAGAQSGRLVKGASRILDRLTGRTGLFLANPTPLLDASAPAAGMLLTAGRQGELAPLQDESYDLVITPDGIKMTAETDIGIIRGLETVLQLLDADENGYFFPAVRVHDKPRFPWRGLLIDAGRHFIPADIIRRNLDAMAAVKMNVLHWHLTEDQGFRIESKAFPKLHQLGSDGLYYTQAEIAGIVAYAGDRGIRVMPEFDLPGHATSWFVGYPELASAPGPYTIERKWGIFDPTFDPTREEIYQFLTTFFAEMATLFPDPCWHIGGDENKGHQWDANPEIQAFMRKNGLADNHALQNHFNMRLEKILDKLGKTMVGWYTDAPPELNKKYIIEVWKGREAMYDMVRRGYRSLLAYGFYIDLIQPTEYHYANDPIPVDSVLTEREKAMILGGEATMWAEFVGPETIDSRIWPRTAAIAERLWSQSEVKDVAEMFRRLAVVSVQLEELGLTHIKNFDMMLRRLAKRHPVDELKRFVDVIEPMYTYSRDRPHVFKSHYPLTRVVDAALPDPPAAREFDLLVEGLIAGGKEQEECLKSLTIRLETLQADYPRLMETINGSPVLWEVRPLAEGLAVCTTIGLEALELVKKQQKPASAWIEIRLALLKKAQVPSGEAELLIAHSLEKLVKSMARPDSPPRK